MNYNFVRYIAWGLLGLGVIISIYFVVSTRIDNFQIWNSNKIDFGVTGQFGDFMGGVVGTLFTLSGTLLIFLTFQEQKDQNNAEAIRSNVDGFESIFFELIKLHRENINELTYTKFDKIKAGNEDLNEMRTAKSRKVFRMIFSEFVECYNEIKDYPIINKDEIIIEPYKTKLNKIIHTAQRSNIDIYEMAYIDIAYSIIYYGVGSEGQEILKFNFTNKYKKDFIENILNYIRLKPRQENENSFDEWVNLIKLSKDKLENEVAKYNKNNSKESSKKNSHKSDDSWLLLGNNYIKYYGGHQHRLGHYFRHLFQSYKYLNTSTFLEPEQKYFYGKMLRAQLSTYEQALLFINSISSLGMKWEFTPDAEEFPASNSKPGKENFRADLISTYHLIKNLPGTQIENFVYKKYYPKVKYENEE